MPEPGFQGLLLAQPAPLARLVSPATASHGLSSASFLSAPGSPRRLCCYTCGSSLFLGQTINKNEKESGGPIEWEDLS